MSLFQNSVVTKQLQSQDKTKLVAQWNVFRNHFHNPTIQDNIRSSKEEQYQGEFLIDLFVNVLGYTKNPTPDFNLTTEYKNVKDSKKADGAILITSSTMEHAPLVKAVIELKGTNTTDLNKIEVQAFGYKNNQPDCVYVITSNFEKLRFYIDNATEYIEFNLFNLTEKEFELLYLCLAYENIANDVPKKLKEQSVSQEKDITKKLYTDYSLFKRELHQDLVKQNPEFDALELFQKSQKLLDRFLFIFFAEDRNLLPTNLIFRINKEWRQLQEMRMNISLYDRYKIYFNDLNKGAKVVLPAFTETTSSQKEEHQIFAYNGGLFQSDAILDNIKINDELLYLHTQKLSHFDFASEVDVNILGHIFENSLNELDEIKAQLEGGSIDKQNTKRKKDGVFYTPKYITKYIVDNTVGKLCQDKKAELNIIEEDYYTDKKRTKTTKQPLLEKLTSYRNWLLQITICDPACGSGAFLNQALDFLIQEHKYIDELQAKLFGDALILSDVEKSILENNLYGVDLNEESVEIAKLSLWLRTAQPNRKLNDLNNNIKCGNSLIDDVTIAGEKAFNWQKAFPQVFNEKQKKAWHITTAIHDSRTSQRMIDYKVREKRAMGAMPEPQVIPLTNEEETIIVEVVSKIVTEDKLLIMAFNVCKDHIHLLLVCDEDEVSKIVQKIKAKTARAVNIHRGVTITRELDASTTKEHAPLSLERGEKQNSLWTQKFGCKEITDDNQLYNTVAYIKNNRVKHELPILPVLQQWSMLHCLYQSYDNVFREEYSGGFDVIIGNPPYVRQELLSKRDKEYFVKNYKTGNGTADLYVYFYEIALNILKQNGVLGFITPNKFYKTKYGKELRQFLIKFKIIELIDFFELKVFEDASTDSQILILEKNNNSEKFTYSPIKNIIDFRDNNYSKLEIESKNLSDEIWVFNNANDLNILNKMYKNSISLKEYTNNGIEYGIKTGLNEAFIINEETKNKIINEDPKSEELIKSYVTATDIDRYYLKNPTQLYFINTYYDLDITNYKGVFNWLLNFDEKLQNRQDKGIHHYNLRACKYYDKFEHPKIIYIHTAVNHKFYYDEENYYINNSCYLISNADKFLSVWLNSKIFSFYKKLNFVAYGDSSESGRAKLDYNKMINVPIPIISSEQKTSFIEKADLMLSLNKDLQEQSQKFQRTIQRKFLSTMEHAPLPKKLQDWYLLSYADFIKELGKLKIKLTLSQEAEWEEYFTTEATKVNAIKTQINATDKAIDVMVYELYGLSEEEIAIVEQS